MSAKSISYPYIPEGKSILYVPADNKFMQLARACARAQSLDTTMPSAAVVVKDGRVRGLGANGSDYHEKHGCERVRRGCKSGQGYELCEGCSPKNHSEPSAIRAARGSGNQFCLNGSDLYLWGHWWCCEPCWKAMEEHGIKSVYLMENSEVLFNKEAKGNIVGNQFATY